MLQKNTYFICSVSNGIWQTGATMGQMYSMLMEGMYAILQTVPDILFPLS
jgi:hypothetical protein